MAVYIIEFEQKLGNPTNPRAQAKFYAGWTEDVQMRLEAHRAGYGAAITAAAAAQGIRMKVAIIFEGDRSLERKIKNRKNMPKLVAKLRAGKTIKSLPAPIFVQ